MSHKSAVGLRNNTSAYLAVRVGYSSRDASDAEQKDDRDSGWLMVAPRGELEVFAEVLFWTGSDATKWKVQAVRFGSGSKDDVPLKFDGKSLGTESVLLMEKGGWLAHGLKETDDDGTVWIEVEQAVVKIVSKDAELSKPLQVV